MKLSCTGFPYNQYLRLVKSFVPGFHKAMLGNLSPCSFTSFTKHDTTLVSGVRAWSLLLPAEVIDSSLSFCLGTIKTEVPPCLFWVTLQSTTLKGFVEWQIPFPSQRDRKWQQEAHGHLHQAKKSIASRSREAIIPLHTALV